MNDRLVARFRREREGDCRVRALHLQLLRTRRAEVHIDARLDENRALARDGLIELVGRRSNACVIRLVKRERLVRRDRDGVPNRERRRFRPHRRVANHIDRHRIHASGGVY